MKKLIMGQDKEKTGLEINLTPLIDVVFILLIFFMVSTTFEKKSSIPIQRPQASSADTLSEVRKNILISFSAERLLLLEGRTLQLDQIQQILMDYLNQTPEITLLIDADQSISTGELIQLIDQARLAGIADIAILTQPQGS